MAQWLSIEVTRPVTHLHFSDLMEGISSARYVSVISHSPDWQQQYQPGAVEALSTTHRAPSSLQRVDLLGSRILQTFYALPFSVVAGPQAELPFLALGVKDPEVSEAMI